MFDFAVAVIMFWLLALIAASITGVGIVLLRLLIKLTSLLIEFIDSKFR